MTAYPVNYYDKNHLVGFAYHNGEFIRYERENRSEPDVEIPPAFVITDSDGGTWTFGNEYAEHSKEFEFNVLRNGQDTGEVAKRIVRRRGRVWIFGHYGWKHWSRGGKTFI